MNSITLNRSYNYNHIYPCNDEISCSGFTKLMYLIINEYKIYRGYDMIKKYIKKNKNKINRKNHLKYTALMIAVLNCGKKCSLKTVKLLINEGADLTLYNHDEHNAVSLAIDTYKSHKNLKLIELLLRNFPNFLDYCFDCYCWPVFFKTLKDTQPEIISLIVVLLPNINKILFDGETYINNAILTKNYCLVNELLKAGCDPKISNSSGKNALISCGMYNITDVNIYQQIISAGCDINYEMTRGKNVLYYLLHNHVNINIEVIKYLLENGINVNAKDKFGKIIISRLCKYYSKYNYSQVLELLLQHGINFDEESYKPSITRTCTYTSETSDINAIKLLLRYGVNINKRNKLGCHGLMFACRYASTTSNIETVKFLLENGADVNLQDDKGNTALMYAAQNANTSNKEVISLLLNYGANINLINSKGNNALLLSCSQLNITCDFETIILLLSFGSNYLITNKNDKTLFSYISGDHITKCFDIIKQIENAKTCLRKVLKQYMITIEKILYKPESLRTKLLSMKWNITNNNYKKVIGWNNLEFFDYFGIHNKDSFQEKILDNIKYMY
ncbi:putative ankyrin repeat protein [Cotonvirus japonicus]|uniref:Ankyrin repeat protein n=1 Tax=Cotonvirus japonicus TaxID=2811091 RepID=A0ABM7NR49_9VIRU|nr:putative ankyrin repeat protein [Cotonvirus japonicus]BCS82566.1 putative ankyrin repeat protein [Cotonvirus japonicus]